MKEYSFKINGNDYTVSIENVDEDTAEVTVNGAPFSVEFEGMDKPKNKEKYTQVSPKTDLPPAVRPTVAKPEVEASPEVPYKSPLPGVIIDIMVKEGDTVKEGQRLMVLEAMKMENNLDAQRSGIITSVKVSRGDSVLEGDVLLTIR